MQNEILWIILLIIAFLIQVTAYKLFGKTGLYVWTAAAVILANIQVTKTIGIFGSVTALGNIIYGSTFLSSDILSENHGKKAAKKAVWLGFFILISATIIMQVTLMFTPHESDSLSPALESIFSLLPRITFASLAAYLISQNFDILFYHYLKKKTKHIWIRNNLSTMLSQLIDNIIFTFIAFIGLGGIFGWDRIFEWKIIFEIFIVSYIMKWIVAVLDTPFIYLAKKIKNKINN